MKAVKNVYLSDGQVIVLFTDGSTQVLYKITGDGDYAGLMKAIEELTAKNENLQEQIDILMKLAEGILYEFQTDNTKAYKKASASGAVCGSLENIEGQTYVVNQMIDETLSWVKNNCDYTVTDGIFTVTGESGTAHGVHTDHFTPIENRIYYASAYVKSDGTNSVTLRLFGSDVAQTASVNFEKLSNLMKYKTSAPTENFYVQSVNATEFSFTRPMLIDLTAMFGSGNEPTSTTEFEDIMMGYKEFTPHTLYNANGDVVVTGKNLFNINSEYVPFKSGTLKRWGIVFVAKRPFIIKAKKTTTDLNAYIGTFDGYTAPSATIVATPTITYERKRAAGRHVIFCSSANLETTKRVLEGIDLLIEYGTGDASEYEPYKENVLPLQSIIDKYFPDGMKSAGSVHDELDFVNKKAIQRVGSIGIDTLDWVYDVTYPRFFALNFGQNNNAVIPPINDIMCNCTSDFYIGSNAVTIFTAPQIDQIVAIGNSGTLNIRDKDFNTVVDFITANKGKKLYYELAEPIVTEITEELEAFETDNSDIIFANTEELPVTSDVKYLVSLREGIL